MKNYKINILGFACLVFMLASCTDQLELNPISEIGESGYYSTSAEVESGVIAIYDGMQDVPLREFAMTEMRSDNTRTKSSEGDWAQFESFDVQPTNLAIGDYWSANYNVIFRANRVLENLDVVADQSASNKFEGEAKYARALSHFNMVRAFGGVPIVDRVIIPSDTDYFSRDDANEVLNAIEADLVDASSLLPSTNSYGRATSGAASALLGKVRLTKGDFSGAASVLSSLIATGDYSLEADYNDVFYSEGNAEVIFAIPYLDDDSNESQDYSFEMTAGGAVSGLNYVTDDFIGSVTADELIRSITLFNPSNPAETGKWMTQSSDARLCGNDWIVMRYADVLLMHAEAILAGQVFTSDASAIASYNLVRERAGMSTLGDGQSLTKDLLLDERRIELAFENHRFYDLVRFGRANEVLSAFASDEGETFEPTDVLLPIPQGEINVSEGLLIQNPGY